MGPPNAMATAAETLAKRMTAKFSIAVPPGRRWVLGIGIAVLLTVGAAVTLLVLLTTHDATAAAAKTGKGPNGFTTGSRPSS
jgi:hypothetical protein